MNMWFPERLDRQLWSTKPSLRKQRTKLCCGEPNHADVQVTEILPVYFTREADHPVLATGAGSSIPAISTATQAIPLCGRSGESDFRRTSVITVLLIDHGDGLLTRYAHARLEGIGGIRWKGRFDRLVVLPTEYRFSPALEVIAGSFRNPQTTCANCALPVSRYGLFHQRKMHG